MSDPGDPDLGDPNRNSSFVEDSCGEDESGWSGNIEGEEEQRKEEDIERHYDLDLPDGELHTPRHICIMDIPHDWKANVTSFCCPKSVLNAINWFQKKNQCCLGYKRTVRPNPEKNLKGRLNFACIHGISHHRKNIHPKPKFRKHQQVNNVGCQMKIFVNQQKDGEWRLRSYETEHVNANGDPAHLTGIDVYKSSRKAKAMVDEEALSLIKEFKAVNAPTNAVADRLSEKFGVNYTRQDIANRINNKLGALISQDSDVLNVNTFLEEIVEGGGEVFAKYHEDTNKCRILLIMTKYQKIDLNLSRPRVFINDTTFGTNSENFKVNK